MYLRNTDITIVDDELARADRWCTEAKASGLSD